MVKIIEDSVNHSVINQILNDACIRLWPKGIPYDKIRLIITDAATYMKKAFKEHPLFTSAIHVTCLAHAIHNLCETIRAHYNLVNRFVAEAKRRITCSKTDRTDLMEKVGFLPANPVITRWGTFLEAVEYYEYHFEEIKHWVNSISSESHSTSILKTLIDDPDFSLQLTAIKKCFFLVRAIKKIETQGLTLFEQFELVTSIKEHILLPDWAKNRFSEILEKNEGLTQILYIYNHLEDQHFQNIMKFAPLVSADVERSFNQFHHILSDRRTSLTLDHLEMMNLVMFNRRRVSPDSDEEEGQGGVINDE